MKDKFVTIMINNTIGNGGMTEKEKDFYRREAMKAWKANKLTVEEVSGIFTIIDMVNTLEVA